MWRETRDITKPEAFADTGYDRESMRRCWEFLDLTSRSFSMVIKELEGELARVVSTWSSCVSLPRSASSTLSFVLSTLSRTT